MERVYGSYKDIFLDDLMETKGVLNLSKHNSLSLFRSGLDKGRKRRTRTWV